MKRKIATNAVAAVFAALAFFGLGATGMAQDFTKYHNYAELSAMLQNLAGANKTLVKLESIGKTLGKWDIWALQIAAPGGVPIAERPGLLIAANFEADHLIGSELSVFIADYLVKNYASNANVKQRLDNYVIYIMPRVNPDGAEFMWAPLKWARRTNTRPYDNDNDGRIDEDGPVDLNKDGLITVMRVKDPNGDYIIDPEEPRLLRKADPKKGERGEFAIYREGIDQDKDGFIGEDGPGGVNINRNFMHEYPYFKPESGRYMVSESETRAVLDWILAHRNIEAILTFGESDNLIVPPNTGGRLSSAKQIDLVEFADAIVTGANRVGIFAAAGGFGGRGGGRGGGGEMVISEEMLSQLMAAGGGQFIMGGGGGGGRGGQQAAAQPLSARAQQPASAAATTVNSADVDYFRLIGAKYVELTGIRQQPFVVNPEGAFFQYGYYQFGVPSFSTPGWGMPEVQRGQGMGMPGMPGGQGAPPSSGGQQAQGAAMMMAQRGTGGGQRGAGMTGASAAAGTAGEQAQTYDRQILQWMDKEKIDGFVAWTKVKDPDLGEVEVGGFKPYAAINLSATDTRILEAVPFGEKGDYIMLGSEGIDNDHDGRVDEDDAGGYDGNRNYPFDWQPNYIQSGAMDYPTQLPEAKAEVDFIFAHPNIAGVQSYHNTGGMILRGPGAEAVGDYPATDIRAYDELGRTGERILPFYRYIVIWSGLYTVHGGFIDWTNDGMGIMSFSNELWSGEQYFTSPELKEQQKDQNSPIAPQKSRYFFNDKVEFGAQFMEWKKFNHPQFGEVEIGGTWRKFTSRIPPRFMNEELCHRNMAFTLVQAAEMPMIQMGDATAEKISGDVYRLFVDIANPKVAPTILERVAPNGVIRPDLLTLDGKNVEIISASWIGDEETYKAKPTITQFIDQKNLKRIMLRNGLAGKTARTIMYIVKGSGEVTVKYDSVKGGSAGKTLKLQ